MTAWKTNKELCECPRNKEKKKEMDYYTTYVDNFLKGDELRDWESFNRCKELWDFLHEKYTFRKKRLKVLDCGTKDGQFTEWLNKKGHDCLGIEIDDRYVKYAQLKNRNVIKGDICNIESKSKNYDLTFAHHVMGLTPDYGKSIQEMVRVTKSGGIIIFCNQIPGNPKKHFQLIQTPKEVEKMLEKCYNHKIIYFDFWRKDEHVGILRRS